MGSFGMGILLAHHQTKSHHRHAETSADIISTETANHILVVWVSQILSCHVWCGAAAAGGGLFFYVPTSPILQTVTFVHLTP